MTMHTKALAVIIALCTLTFARGNDAIPLGRVATGYVLGTTQQTTTGTTEQILGTFSLPAGGLDAVGRGLTIIR
jgi:hypothetical protein